MLIMINTCFVSPAVGDSDQDVARVAQRHGRDEGASDLAHRHRIEARGASIALTYLWKDEKQLR